MLNISPRNEKWPTSIWPSVVKKKLLQKIEKLSGIVELGIELGSDHAKYLIFCIKSSENGCFLVLNILFWVQNCWSKDFLKKYYLLNGPFGGQKASFKTVLEPILGFFRCYYSWLPWSDPRESSRKILSIVNDINNFTSKVRAF
jgi:hypothetical protein